MKVLIIDDHSVVHLGLRRLLGDEFPGASFGEARDCPQAEELMRSEPWTLVVLDIDLPGRSGLELLRSIHTRQPSLPVLVFSMHAEDQFAIRALRAGALAYVRKDSSSEQLVEAVHRVIRGRRYISTALAERLADQLNQTGNRKPVDALSDREFEVMRLIASGHTTTTIAAELALSVKTVSTYRTRTLEKLNLKTTSELIRYAIDHDLPV